MSLPIDSFGIGVRPGEVLAGKFRVERVLGQGGMGAVVAAHHLILDRKVALKFLLPAALQDRDAVTRFVREAKAAVRIRSEHVVQIIDVGHLESGAPYIVMEHLDGTDLSAWLAARGAMRIDQAVDFILQACEALADAHVLGIVHRDLKPANMFCSVRSDGQPCIKVLDFGISKIVTPGGTDDMTRTHTVLGTPYYMSPEQTAASRTVDLRSDIWSLGVILFELLTGKTPFNGESVGALAVNVATLPPPPLRELRADAPPGLQHVLATCLEKDRHRRYQSVGDFAVALGAFGSSGARTSVDRILGTLRQAGIHSAPLLPAAGPSAQSPGTASSWGATGPQGPSGRKNASRTIMGLAALVVSVAAIGASIYVVHSYGSWSYKASSALSPTTSSSFGSAPTAPVSATSAPSDAPTTPSAGSAIPSASATAAAASAKAIESPTARVPTPRHDFANPAASRPPVPAPGAACNPPYYYDADGHKQYKPECM